MNSLSSCQFISEQRSAWVVMPNRYVHHRLADGESGWIDLVDFSGIQRVTP
jgi:hypothetical protein